LPEWGPTWGWGPRGEWLDVVAGDRMLRLPARPLGAGGADRIRLGLPREVFNFGMTAVKGNIGGAWSGREGQRLFVTKMDHSLVQFVEVGAPCREKWRAPMPQASFAAASPDGRWVAAGSFDGGSGVRIWEAQTGRLEKELPIGDAGVEFSPDSHWLYMTTARASPRGAELCAWRVGTWEPAHRLALNRTSSGPAHPGIASDGTALAVPCSQETMRLVLRAESFEEIATLTAPEPGLAVRSDFSRDGALLVIDNAPYLHLWDLRRLRQELKGLDLDWDLPDYPPAPPRSPRLLRVVVERGE
jgi:hypothetical protein